jgi:hypothetical protein
MAKNWESSAVHISSLADWTRLHLMIFLKGAAKGGSISPAEARRAQRESWYERQVFNREEHRKHKGEGEGSMRPRRGLYDPASDLQYRAKENGVVGVSATIRRCSES